MNTNREQILREGFCRIPDILDASMLQRLREVTDHLIASAPPAELDYVRYQGTNIEVSYQHPVFAELIAWPKTLAALSEMGYPGPKFLSGHLLSKPPHGPALYWHQDWAAWGDACSAQADPPQVFVMYYLTDTSPENGCLRVIPGSHRRRIPLHDQLPEAHTEASYTAPPDSPAFSRHADEVNAPVKAGDILIGDARVLHAAHPNQTDRRRSCLTLWYYPDWEGLPEPVQALFCRKKPLAPPDWWEGDAGKAVEPLIPWYNGGAEATPWNRIPGEHLKPEMPAA